jgi:hypothetical protein
MRPILHQLVLLLASRGCIAMPLLQQRLAKGCTYCPHSTRLHLLLLWWRGRLTLQQLLY